jgi:hypothetical protein
VGGLIKRAENMNPELKKKIMRKVKAAKKRGLFKRVMLKHMKKDGESYKRCQNRLHGFRF